MNARIKIIEKGEKSILFADYSNLKPDEILALVPEIREIQIEKRIKLLIFDVANTRFNAEIKEAGKESIKFVESKLGKTHTALLGIRGIQKIIASAVSRDVYFASNLDDAVEHLLNCE